MRDPSMTVRTSLEVGFPGGELAEEYRQFRGKNWRSVGVMEELPYEDEQFQVVILHESAVNRKAVKEAHRVLKKEGTLLFTVRDRGKSTVKGAGFTSPEVCSILRDGFNIVGIEGTPFWNFWTRPRLLSFRAQKKNWKVLNNRYRPYIV